MIAEAGAFADKGKKAFRELKMRLLFLPLSSLLLAGCIAKAAVDVVTLPVKVAGAGVDAVTTSQSEADEKRGRQIREREACYGKEDRRAERERRAPDYERCDRKR